MGPIVGRHLRTPLVLAVVAAACVGCGNPSPNGGDGASETETEPALDVYRVQPGDTLSAIAREQCGDVAAVVSLFEANHGRLQADGKALVDLDLIAVGWDLVIDCSAAAAKATFEPAPEPSAPLPTESGAFPLQEVPEHDLVLPAVEEAPDEGEPCPGSSSLPLTKPAVLQAGQSAAGVSLRHGDRLVLDPEGFSTVESAELVDDDGRRLPIPAAGEFFELYADPTIPLGHYGIEIQGGGMSAQGSADVVSSDVRRLVRRGPLAYDVVGAGSSIAFAVYRWTPGTCGDGSDLRLETGPLSLVNGLGRVSISPAASAGTYCLTVEGEDPTVQCGPTRRFVVP